ncbi:MAG: riboflavin synthase subunit alpha [Actinobacteria bacterium]|nr:riboflavin synthase subunit alpha [Actinomycetota bacterium]
MFTGIVKGLGTVVSVTDKPGLRTLVVELPAGYAEGLSTGASVAVDGCCLTAVHIERDRVSFDVMEETLRKTTAGGLVVDSRVNVERSFRVGDEVGGHLVSGHVTGTAEIVSIDRPDNNHVLTFRVPTEWMKYVLPKGFVALDGCSLTIVDVDRAENTFTVWLIPETLRLTTFGLKSVGDKVNLEIDSRTQAIVETVEAYLESESRKVGESKSPSTRSDSTTLRL